MDCDSPTSLQAASTMMEEGHSFIPHNLLNVANAINKIMAAEDITVDKMQNMCRAFVKCLPAVEIASVTFYSLENREAMVCGVHTEGMSPVDMHDILYMPDSMWSVLQPAVQEGEYLASSIGTGIMNDHDILVELHPGADHFVSIPIECPSMDKQQGMLCMVLGTSQHTFQCPRGSSLDVALNLMKTLLEGSVGRALFVRDMQQMYQILKSRTMPELAYQVLSALEVALAATYCQKDCKLSLGLLPDREQVLSIFRVVTDNLVLLNSPGSFMVKGMKSKVTVQNILVNKQGSLAHHCLTNELEDALFSDLTTLVMTTRNLDAKDVMDQIHGMHTCAVLLSLLTVDGMPFCILYLTSKANTDLSAELTLIKRLKPFLTELMLVAIRDPDFVTQPPGELRDSSEKMMSDTLSQGSHMYHMSLLSLERLRHNVAKETNVMSLFASYNSAHSSLHDLDLHSSMGRQQSPVFSRTSSSNDPKQSMRQQSPAYSNVSLVLNDKTSANSSIAALVTQMQTSIQERQNSRWDRPDDRTEQLSQLVIHGELGQGGYSRVYSGTWNMNHVAIKVTKLEDPTHHQTLAVAIATEVAIMSTMNHVNIVKLFDVINNVPLRVVLDRIRGVSLLHKSVQAFGTVIAGKPVVDDSAKCCVVIMELCPLGNLSRALRKGVFVHNVEDAYGNMVARTNLPPILAALIDIASGFERLHSMGVMHCDLKPGNLMLVKEPESPSGILVKVGDFGLSKILPLNSNSIRNTNIGGTIAWAAPECLVPDKRVGPAVDIYAFGMLMWQCITAKAPFQGIPSSKIAVAVVLERMRPEFPPGTMPQYVELAQRCWNHEPNHRPTATELIRKLQQLQRCLT